MTIRRDAVVIGTALALLVVLAAAMVAAPSATLPAASPASSASPSAGSQTARIIREGIVGRVETLDPLFARTRAEQDLDALIFGGLTALGPGGTVVPGLAERWVSTGSGRNYTFTLRRDATWQDGVPVTADDVVFTVLTMQHPDYTGPLAGAWRGVTVKKIDQRTVQFTLATQAASFLQATTTQPILPAHLLQGVPIDSLATSGFGRQPVGSGPYRLVSLTAKGARLERVATDQLLAPPTPDPHDPFAWRPSEPAGGPDGFQFSFFSDAASLAAAFRSGALDTAAGLDAVTASSVASEPGVRLIRYPRATLTAVVPNLRFGHNLFRNVHVRRALLEAIDRDAIVRDILAGEGTRADTLIPPTSWAFDQKAAGHVTTNLKTAAKELVAAGWRRTAQGWYRPGVKTPVTFELLAVDASASPVASQVAHQVASDWTDLGLHVNVTVLPASALVGAKLVPGRFDAAIMDIDLGRDPDLYPLLASTQAVTGGSNVAGYQSASLDKLLESSRLFDSIPDRKKLLSALQARLAQEIPLLPLFYADVPYVVRNTVQGPTANTVTQRSERFWDVLTWRVAERPAS